MRGASDLLVFAHLLLKALVIGQITREGTVDPKRPAISSFLLILNHVMQQSSRRKKRAKLFWTPHLTRPRHKLPDIRHRVIDC
jgi:hypothetical protein